MRDAIRQAVAKDPPPLMQRSKSDQCGEVEGRNIDLSRNFWKPSFPAVKIGAVWLSLRVEEHLLLGGVPLAGLRAVRNPTRDAVDSDNAFGGRAHNRARTIDPSRVPSRGPTTHLPFFVTFSLSHFQVTG